MMQVLRDLEQVRWRAWGMLVSQRLLRWLAALLAVLLILGVSDYLLRLPGWLRLITGVALLAAGVSTFIKQIALAAQFWPELSQLALRAERLYPHLAGSLASSVEFALNPQQYRDPQRTADMADHSVQQAQARLQGVDLHRILDHRTTLHAAGKALASVVVFAVAVLVAGENSVLAAKRWLAPLGDTQWPRRTEVIPQVREGQVFPIDSPVPLKCTIDRGYSPHMRTWVNHRVISPAGVASPWQSQLMNEQQPAGLGQFEQMVDFTSLAGDLASQASEDYRDWTLEVSFEAGDHLTDPIKLRLVPRPAIVSVQATIEPPAYAQGLVSRQQVSLQDSAGQVASVSALEHSQVMLAVEFNKPLPDAKDGAAMFPGLATVSGAKFEMLPTDAQHMRPGARISFNLQSTLQTPIQLTDEHGITNLSDRLYKLQAITDQQPVVAMLEPASEEAVLPTAVVPVSAMAKDDVAAELLRLEAVPTLQGKPAPQPLVLNQVTGRTSRLQAEHTLELSSLKVKPGDEVLLQAVGQDVFEIAGRRHEPVTSAPRRIRIIDEATLMTQLRRELSGVRQQAIRLEASQKQAIEAGVRSLTTQGQVTAGAERQQELVQGLSRRMKQNRLNEASLEQLLSRAQQMLEQAQQQSSQATQQIEQARREGKQELSEAGRQSQQRTQAALRDLVTLLDQGRDSLALQLQVRELRMKQQQLLAQSRQIMPRTLGQDPQSLPAAEKKQLSDLATSQQNLAAQARQAVQQMQSTAEQLAAQGKQPQDQASAQALSEAAKIAQRQGLNDVMEQAAGNAQQNQMATAAQRQQEAVEVLDRMLEELQKQEQRRQEILNRIIDELAQAIERLIRQQQAHVEMVEQAKRLEGLDQPLALLRQNTMAVQEQAAVAPETAAIAEVLGGAVGHQAQAVQSLRKSEPDPALTAERLALAKLQEALELARKMQEQRQSSAKDEQREKLRQEYLRLLALQQEIFKQTQALSGEPALDRRQRATLLGLAQQQDEIKAQARELGQQVDGTLVFKHVHEELSAFADKAAALLKQANAGKQTLSHENSVAVMLKLMADALEQPKPRDDFERPENDGGGGEGGPQPEPPLIPPLAELRALRGMQALVHELTRAAEQAAGNAQADPQTRELLEDLGDRQRQLHEQGVQLLEQLQKQRQGG